MASVHGPGPGASGAVNAVIANAEQTFASGASASNKAEQVANTETPPDPDQAIQDSTVLLSDNPDGAQAGVQGDNPDVADLSTPPDPSANQDLQDASTNYTPGGSGQGTDGTGGTGGPQDAGHQFEDQLAKMALRQGTVAGSGAGGADKVKQRATEEEMTAQEDAAADRKADVQNRNADAAVAKRLHQQQLASEGRESTTDDTSGTGHTGHASHGAGAKKAGGTQKPKHTQSELDQQREEEMLERGVTHEFASVGIKTEDEKLMERQAERTDEEHRNEEDAVAAAAAQGHSVPEGHASASVAELNPDMVVEAGGDVPPDHRATLNLLTQARMQTPGEVRESVGDERFTAAQTMLAGQNRGIMEGAVPPDMQKPGKSPMGTPSPDFTNEVTARMLAPIMGVAPTTRGVSGDDTGVILDVRANNAAMPMAETFS